MAISYNRYVRGRNMGALCRAQTEISRDGSEWWIVPVAREAAFGKYHYRVWPEAWDRLLEENDTLHQKMEKATASKDRIQQWKMGDTTLTVRLHPQWGLCIKKDEVAALRRYLDILGLPAGRSTQILETTGLNPNKRQQKTDFNTRLMGEGWILVSYAREHLVPEVSQHLWDTVWQEILRENASSLDALQKNKESLDKIAVWTCERVPILVKPTIGGLAIALSSVEKPLKPAMLARKFETFNVASAQEYLSRAAVVSALNIPEATKELVAVWDRLREAHKAGHRAVDIDGKTLRIDWVALYRNVCLHRDDVETLGTLLNPDLTRAGEGMLSLVDAAARLKIPPDRLQDSGLWRAYSEGTQATLPQPYQNLHISKHKHSSKQAPELYVHRSAISALARYLHLRDPERPDEFLDSVRAQKEMGLNQAQK